MTKRHNFVKNKKTKKSKSYAYLQIMMKNSPKFQINSIKIVTGVVGTRYELAGAITSSKMAETKIRNHMHILIIMIRRQSIKFQISPMKDVRGVGGTRSDGRTDGQTHTRNDECHFYSPPLPTLGDKK